MVAFCGRKGVTAVVYGSVDEVSGAVQPGVQAALRLADQQLNLGACRQQSQPGGF
jgi:microcompartment protein CcmL/EutN